MDEYKNDINKDYNICELFEKMLLINFWITTTLSIILCFYWNDIICISLIIIQIIYFTMDTFNDVILKNNAESELRKALLSNSYNKNLSDKTTNKYYNNYEKKPLKKLGVNCFESSFFSCNILKKMLLKNSIIFFSQIVLWILIILISSEYSFILCITQTIFSAQMAISYIKYLFFNNKVKIIYDNFFKIFITHKYTSNKEVLLMENVLEYECIKSYSHVILSSNVFKKMNADLTLKWKDLEEKIRRKNEL